MSRPRVLHLCASRAFSGAEAVVCSMVQGLESEYEGVYGSPDGPIRQAVEGRGILFEPLTELSRGAMRALISRVEPDIVHAHDYTASLLAAFSAPGLPVLSHIHLNNPLMQRLNARSLAFGLAMRRFSRIFVVDQAVVDEHVLRRSLSRRAIVATNFVDIPQVVERAIEGGAPPVELLFVGRLTPQKDPIGFLRVVKEVLRRRGSVSAAMVGDGEISDQVHAVRSELKLEEHVEMRGFQSNPYSHIAAAKVVVMPSLWEGFGLVAVETMAIGTPLVVRPVGGLKHVIGEGDAALTADTVEELAAAADRLLGDSSLREKIGEAGKLRAAHFGDKRRYLELFRQAYSDVLAHGKA